MAAVAVSAGEARVVSCPEGPLSASVRAAKIPETAEAFTVSFRFSAVDIYANPRSRSGCRKATIRFNGDFRKRQKTMRTFRFLPIVIVWAFTIQILNFDHSRFDKIGGMC